VYVDGDSIGVTPLDQAIALDPGTHSVSLRHPDFPAYEVALEAIPGKPDTLEVSLWTTVGTLQLEVSPWADVYIDGEYRDKTPISPERPLIVAPGEHTLRLEHPSLGAYDTTFSVDAGKQWTLRHTMRKSPP
jgi:serine/threonine-protein kinase